MVVEGVDIEGRCSEGGKLAVGSTHARTVTHLDSQPLFAIQTQVSLLEGERDDRTYRFKAGSVLVYEK